MDKIARLRQEINKRYQEYRAKMKTDDFTYYEGMADALDLFEQFLDTLQEEPDKDLEEAARLYAIPHYTKDIDKSHIDEYPYDTGMEAAFIAGAQWQAEQDDRDVVFWKGMQHAIAGMKKDAVEGVIIDSGFDDGTAFVTMNIPDRRYDRGDRVKLIIIKDDGKSD